MSEPIHDKVLNELIKEMIGDGVNHPPYVQGILDNYINDFRVKTGGYPKMDMEALTEELKKDTLLELFLKATESPEFKDSLYKKSYERLKALVNEGTTWGDLFGEIYSEEQHLNEIFVRLVEEKQGVAITSAKQLQELTDIKEVYGYGDKKPTKKEAQEIAHNQVEDTFIKAMSWRYSKALEDILDAGGKYNDLLRVKPSYFNLPETWSGCLASDQGSSILWAIVDTFLIFENTPVKPDLKAIAREIEAPYSVLMEAHKLCNKWKLQS
jgi:hypothetical protein